MQKKKEVFFEKIIKKDYNNELEKILEKKYFEEKAKNILLSTLYKLETSYKDYEIVKKNVMSKDEFIRKIVDIIKDECDTLKIIKINAEKESILGNKTFLVDKKNKSIISYPIERIVLYCISKISKKNKIIKDKYAVIDKTLSDLINIGDNINFVEPIRDFNGFSWTTITKEIESLEHNIIYQDLRILLGHKFLNEWIYNNEVMIDYYEKFQNILKEEYGEKNAKKIVEIILKLSVLLELKFDKIEARKLKQEKEEVKEKLQQMENKEEYIKKITNEKKEINKKIKNIDETINDKKTLQEEYIQRNKLLPLEKKIFSMKILKKIKLEEKENLMKQLENLNNMLNPQKFVAYKKSLEDRYKYLKLTECEKIEKDISKLQLELQKEFLKCFGIRIEKANTKSEIITLIHEYRYYLMLPYNEKERIHEENKLQSEVEEISKKLINKAIANKDIVEISKNKELNYKVLKNIFTTRIINLEDLYIKIVKDKEKLYLQFLDDDVFEEKIELEDIEQTEEKEFDVRLNKNIKLLLA